MVRSHYSRELERLHVEIIKMGGMIENAIACSVRAFEAGDAALCERIVRADKEVDEIEKTIESRCLWLIAREQPIASDLREITTALKMVTDMERIGDNAADIAEITLRMAGRNNFSGSLHLPLMAKTAAAMVHDAVNAYVNADLTLARTTEKKDDEVDALFNQVKIDLVHAFQEDDTDIDSAIDFLLIAKYLERIADHAVNICEWVEFSQTGKHKNAKIF